MKTSNDCYDSSQSNLNSPQTSNLVLLEAVILNFPRAGAKGNIVDQVKIIVCVEEMMIVFVSLI